MPLGSVTCSTLLSKSGVSHARGIGIGLRREPVQTVVNIRNRLPFAVGLAGEIVVGVVGIGLGLRRGEVHFDNATKGIVGEESRVRIGVGNAEEIIFCVVSIRRGMVCCVGHTGQPVGVIIGVVGGLAILICH